MATTRGLFVTGTDTDVGKTYVSVLIARELVARGMRMGVYKPACSGAVLDQNGQARWQDVEELSAAIGGSVQSERICPQRFLAPLAPPVAARLEGMSVDPALLRTAAAWWTGRVDVLLVEGVGGLLCPITERETIADLAVDLGYPLLIVARLGLGTINHTLLTVEAAKSRSLKIAGIVLNEGSAPADDGAKTNPAEIAKHCDVPVLGVVRRAQREGIWRNGRRVEADWAALAERSPRKAFRGLD